MRRCPTCEGTYPDNVAFCPRDGTLLLEAGVWSEGMVIRGKYRILSELGRGGMGAVYKALHIAFDELRALKVMNSEFMSDELFVRRFKQEAVITRKLQHPNAVRVDDIDEAEDGRPFIVMEYIRGQNLKELIKQDGYLPVPRVCSIVKQVASALEAAHRLGMVHRDIKPANIVLVETPAGEKAKVLDFGIAKLKEARATEAAGLTLTGTGMTIGTPPYMSPEQAIGKRGDELDGRSDLYSLGVVMYQMLTGEMPLKGDTPVAMLVAHIHTPPRPIHAARPDLQIPDAVATLVMRTLEKKPELRPSSAQVLIEEIERAEEAMRQTGATRPLARTPVVTPESVQEKAEQERQARQRAEQERLAREKAEAARRAAEKAEAERLAWEQAEQERVRRERAEQERRARQKAEAERRAAEKAEAAEKERLALEKAEQERLARQRVEQDRREREKAEATRLAAEKAEGKRAAREKAEQERLARDRAGLAVPEREGGKERRWGARLLVAIPVIGLGVGVWWYLRQPPPTQAPETPHTTSAPATNPAAPPATSATPSGSHVGPKSDSGKPPVFPESPAPNVGSSSSSPSPSSSEPMKSQPVTGASKTVPPPESPPKPRVDRRKIDDAIKKGDTYLDQGEYDKAIHEFQRGLSLDPKNSTLRSRVDRATRAKAAEEKHGIQ